MEHSGTFQGAFVATDPGSLCCGFSSKNLLFSVFPQAAGAFILSSAPPVISSRSPSLKEPNKDGPGLDWEASNNGKDSIPQGNNSDKNVLDL